MQNGIQTMRKLFSAVVVLVMAACESGQSIDPEMLYGGEQSTSSTAQELHIEVGRTGIAYDFHPSNHVPHGVAGDERLVFVGQPLSGRVAVVDRFTGNEVGTLPAPPAGWLLPFAIRVLNSGQVSVLDSGGFPSPVLDATERIYEYNYTYNRITRAFSATLKRTISFAGIPMVFAEDMERLPDGSYVVSDSVLGTLWNVSKTGVISPAILPASFDPADGIPQMAACPLTPVTIDGVPFSTFGNFAPGVGSMANRNGKLYFGSSCTGGIYRVPVATLTDPSRTPTQRAADIQTVATRQPGAVFETIKGLAFNRWDSSDGRLYGLDAVQRKVVRYNVNNGRREVIADDPQLFDFPVTAQFLPPVLGVSPLLVGSDQEYRLAALNPLITEDLLHPPFIVAKVYPAR